MEEEGQDLNLVTLLAIIILMIYTVSAPIFEKIHFHYMHESGLCMIIGVIISLIAIFFDPHTNFTKSINFSGDVFFTFVLPPIIFSAGYNLHRASFFKYFIYILSFGVFGTIMSFLWVAPLSLLFNYFNCFYLTTPPQDNNQENQNNIVNNATLIFSNIIQNITENISNTDPPEFQKTYVHFTTAELLLFASVISATDTIAALTFIHEDTEPKLFAILFGEGVVNDAVCIVLYRILREFTLSGKEFTSGTPVSMFGEFLKLAFFSFLIGLCIGCLCAFMLKFFLKKEIFLNRTQEISIILFFAFISYTFSEELGLSPIVTLLFSGIFMSNYAFYNLSFQAREESSIVSKILSNIAEGFVFTYLGLTSISIAYNSFCLSFVILVFIFVLIGRFLAVYGISFFLNICKLKIFSFDMSERGITFFAGCIRGAIAFGLAISMPGDEGEGANNKKMLISSTLILVYITTLLFGALMSPIVKFFTKGKNTKKRNKPETEFIGEDFRSYSLQGFDGETLTIGDFENFLNKPYYSTNKIEGLWNKIDEKILKPIFIDNYKDAREEHSQIAKEIMQLFENHEKNKIKQKAINKYKKNYGIDNNDIDNENENMNGIEMKDNDDNDISTNLSELNKFDINNSGINNDK